jgi:hypothetical protein
MARLFISYARRDMPVVAQLVNELREMGHEPFYDQDLTGGQRWWDVLLTRIEESDGFLPVLSDAYIDSEACGQEAHWAADVGVPILPLDLGSVGPEMCDPLVAQTNWIRYGLEDRTSIARLARALGALPPRTPPAQAPARPPVPVTYLTATRQEIHDAGSMPVDRQLAIIATLRAKLGTDDDASARTLLTELRRRPDVAHASAVEIDHMLGSGPAPASGPAQRPPKDGDGRSRRVGVAAAAAAAVLVIAGGTSWVVTQLGGDDDKGGGSPAAGPGGDESMSESMSEPASGSAAPSVKTTDLMAILTQADEFSQGDSLVPTATCSVVAADEVSCTPEVMGVSSVDFRLYDSLDDLYADYQSRVADDAGQPFEQVVNDGECDQRSSSGEVSWNHNKHHSIHYTVDQLMHDDLDDAKQAAGRVYCGLHGSVQTVIWTQNNEPTLLAVAEGAPHDQVRAWWRKVHHLIACITADGKSKCPDMGDMSGMGAGDASAGATAEASDEPSDGMTGGMG